jgi:hypothetical protein
MSSASPFQVEQLRMRNAVASMEAIGVFLLSLFVTAFGPSLLLRYLYADQQLMEQPMLLEVLPVVCFVVGVGYFLYTMFGNITRELKARKLEKEVIESGCDCGGCCGDCDTHDHGSMMSAMDDDSFSMAMKKSDSKSKKPLRK